MSANARELWEDTCTGLPPHCARSAGRASTLWRRHMLLEDKCCVVTGAASKRGLGMATAKLFASEGARVAILDLDAEQAKAAAAEVGNQHIGLACNVTD